MNQVIIKQIFIFGVNKIYINFFCNILSTVEKQRNNIYMLFYYCKPTISKSMKKLHHNYILYLAECFDLSYNCNVER